MTNKIKEAVKKGVTAKNAALTAIAVCSVIGVAVIVAGVYGCSMRIAGADFDFKCGGKESK